MTKDASRQRSTRPCVRLTMPTYSPVPGCHPGGLALHEPAGRLPRRDDRQDRAGHRRGPLQRHQARLRLRPGRPDRGHPPARRRPDRAAASTSSSSTAARSIDPSTISGRDLGDVRPGGLGVHIIRSTMDKVRYRPRPGGGMLLRMVKYVDDPADNPSQDAGLQRTRAAKRHNTRRPHRRPLRHWK